MSPVILGQEGVDADQGQAAVVFLAALIEHAVVHRLFLDLAALVHRVHRAERAAALADRFEFLVDGFLDGFGELVDDETALPRVSKGDGCKSACNSERHGVKCPGASRTPIV